MFDLADVLKDVPKLDTSKKQLEYIKRDLIDPDPNNFYSLTGIEELAANIQLCGLQQPILVRPIDGGRYMVVSGHRRRAAIELLAADEPEKWEEIPCLVERDEASPELQQLRLIYANANTREKSSAELAAEAEQVEELLYKLKDQGYDFPGRMRDHVAAAVKASKSKLARLKLIRENLIDEFEKLWEAGNLRDSVAYTLAKTTQSNQRIIWDAQTKGGTAAFRCTDGWVESLVREMAEAADICTKMPCNVQHTEHCSHFRIRVSQAAALGQYTAFNCQGCCLSCWDLKDCKFSCPSAADARQVLRTKARAAKKPEKVAQEAREAPRKEFVRNVYQRVGELREAKGVGVEDFIRASEICPIASDAEKLQRLESGRVSPDDRLPGYIYVDSARRLIAVADLLGCSLDYLLGRTDEVSPAKNVPNLDTGWRTGEPDEPGVYACSYCELIPPYHDQLLMAWYWDGTQWLGRSGVAIRDARVLHWIPLPLSSGSCITGMSDSGKCGAAAFCSEPATCCLQCGKYDCNGRCGWIE